MAVSEQQQVDSKQRGSRLGSIGGSLKEAVVMPRVWHGMPISVWFRLLWRNRFAVSPLRLPMAAAICGFSVFNSTMRKVQERIYGEKADSLKVKPPLFILGHWRSGTTLLHELLVQDRRHTFATTYQCFAPNHFIVTEEHVRRWFGFVLPSTRPMDNMRTGWERPQEDEFALCNLGIPSPYLCIAFPNRPFPYREYLTLEGLSDAQLARWKAGLQWFLRRLSFGDSRRIILKSPTHTARVRVLLDLFPQAKFVHIVRDPRAVFPSTVRLWKSLAKQQGLQIPRERPDLEEFVFDNFERMYTAFEADRGLIPPENFYELRYEDLVANPLGELRNIYDRLDLDDFAETLPAVEKYLEEVKDYRPNRHQLSAEREEQIRTRWGRYMRPFGYLNDEQEQPDRLRSAG